MASHTHDDNSFKNAYMDRMGARTITTKPSTAAQQKRLLMKKKQGYMSGGSLAGAFGVNPTEVSPRGSAISSGVKGIYSTTKNAGDYDKRNKPRINRGQVNRKAPHSQGHNAKRRIQKKYVKKVGSKQRNPFEYAPKSNHMNSEEGGVFTLPGVYNGSESYIKGIKAPSNANIIGAKMNQH